MNADVSFLAFAGSAALAAHLRSARIRMSVNRLAGNAVRYYQPRESGDYERLWIAVAGRRVVGILAATRHGPPPVLVLDFVSVAERRQRRGIATGLVRLLMAHAAEKRLPVQTSRYTADGHRYARPVLVREAQAAGVTFIDSSEAPL